MRTAFVLLAFLAIVASLPRGAAPYQDHIPTKDLAERIVEEATTRFAVSRSDWRASVPSATWREYLGEPFYYGNRHPEYPWPEGMWCAVADDVDGELSRQAVFYAIRPYEPLDCRLEQLTFRVRAAESAAELFTEISLALDRRFESGSPVGVGETVPGVHHSEKAESAMKWYAGTYEVFVVRAGIRIIATGRQLLLYKTLRQPDYLDVLGMEPDPDERLASAVEGRFPDVAELLRNRSADAVLDRTNSRCFCSCCA